MIEPVEFREMALVLSLSEERSFTRTAEKNYTSQPALSKAIRKVEKKVGASIFDRTVAPLRITPEGERILEYFRRLTATQSELSDYCESLRRQKRNDITVGAPSFFCTFLLPPVVSTFQLEHPDISVKLIEANDHELRDLLLAGVLDMALSVEEDMPTNLQNFVLKKEHLILAVPGSYEINKKFKKMALGRGISPPEFPKKPPVPLDDFLNERFLVLKEGNDIRTRTMTLCRDAGFEPQIVMELDQLLTAYHLAESGLGVTFIRSSIPYYAGFSPDLCLYRIDHPATERSIRVYLSDASGAEGRRAPFIEFLQNYPLPD